MLTKEQQSNFVKLVEPLIKWLGDNASPHTSILIDRDCALINFAKYVFRPEKTLRIGK